MSHKTSKKIKKRCHPLSSGGSGIYLGVPDPLDHPDQLPCGEGFLRVTFLPQSYTLDNYIKLFTDTSILNFRRCS